jgi:cardiolipin synthase
LKLLIQPGSGVEPLVDAINKAKNRVEIVIFRFDRAEIEKALAKAVTRGVFVHALIAYTNRGGERNLRKLEMRLLASGVTVARTADDLARYHSKFMIVDRRELYLLAFNFTYLDMEHSRSFGIVSRNAKLVQEAAKLFEADTKRQPCCPGLAQFVVSPLNSRTQLSAFIKGARRELLIYDPEVSDGAMIRLLEERAAAGVTVRIVGRLTRTSACIQVHKLPQRLHARAIIRDSRSAFIGSQSLRELELGSRREVGIIFRDPKAVTRLAKTFQEDWRTNEEPSRPEAQQPAESAAEVARKVAKAIARDLTPVTPVLEVIVKEVVGNNVHVDLDQSGVEASVKDAVKEAVKEVVRDVVESVVEQNGAEHAR